MLLQPVRKGKETYFPWHMLWNRSAQTFFSFSAVIALWNTIKKERRPVLHVVPCLVTCVAFLLCQKDNIYWRDLPGVMESFKSGALSCSIMSISNQHSINTFWKWMSVLYIIGYYLHSHSFFLYANLFVCKQTLSNLIEHKPLFRLQLLILHKSSPLLNLM